MQTLILYKLRKWLYMYIVLTTCIVIQNTATLYTDISLTSTNPVEHTQETLSHLLQYIAAQVYNICHVKLKSEMYSDVKKADHDQVRTFQNHHHHHQNPNLLHQKFHFE